MRICTNCGAQFSDSELFCPKCGQEVQLVPNFETIESRMAESQRLQEEAEKKRAEEREYLLSLEKKRSARRRKIILIISLMAAAAVTVIGILIAMAYNRVTNSYDYQLQQAQIAYEDGDLDRAMEYARKAVLLSDNNRDARYMTALVDFDTRNYEDASATLEKLLDRYPEDADAYVLLFRVYEELEMPARIQARLKTCPVQSVLDTYADYNPKAPVPDVEPGLYDTHKTVTLQAAAKGTIRYTMDGTTPTARSAVYTEPIELPEGKTTIRAYLAAYTGIDSPVMTASYEISLETPPSPEIEPSSGTYRKLLAPAGSVAPSALGKNISLTTPKITVKVPEGYTCYYAFDQKPDSESTRYTKPVDMQVGEHVFYAVLESPQGKLGRVGSVTYVYAVVTPTPTPTPKVEQYYFPAPEVTEEPEPTEEPVPTEEPAAEPTGEPAAEPTPDPAAPTPEQTQAVSETPAG